VERHDRQASGAHCQASRYRRGGAVDSDRLVAARAYGDSILPLSTGKSYVNAIDDDAVDKVRAAFGASNYDRLVAIKDRYDPDNVFHLNQNIRPSGG
jgi:FAD/FMN-containing dehydrogenase